jgi:hypothetical protein
MREAPDFGFGCTESGGETRFRLPRRRPGPIGCVGVFLVGCTLVISGFAGFWMVGASHAIFGQGQFSLSGLLFTALGLPFLFLGLVPAAFGLAIMFGSSEVVLTDRWVRSVDCIGPLRWPHRRRPIESVRRFQVVGQSDARGSATRGMSMLLAVRARGRPCLIAWGYPHNLLLSLGNELASYCEAVRTGGVFPFEAPPISVVSVEIDDEGEVISRSLSEPAPTKPPRSRCTVERSRGELRITIPPAGLRKGSKGLFSFAIIWLLLTGMIGAVALIASGTARGLAGAMVPLAFTLLFVGIGLAMLLGAINMGRRRAIIDVISDTLLISRQSIFGIRQREWRRDELQAIRVGPSGMKADDVPILNLQIMEKSGEQFGMLSQLEEEELDWIAAELCAVLGLQA